MKLLPTPARYFVAAILLALTVMALLAANVPQTSSANVPADGTEPLPAGTSIETLLPNMVNPIAMAFDPAGRLFYTEKTTGNVRLYSGGVLQTNPVITFSVNSSGEQGLLGIAVDPNFNSNRFVYVFYTCNCTPRENRVVRFEENGGVGSNPVTVFTSPNDTGASNHNGGNIHFGQDGKLYISLGDDGCCPSNSQNVTVTQGKMHRINGDGTIPTDNPVFTQTGALPSLFAMGLRNSFDFDVDPYTTPNPLPRIFASENGPGCDDEMNRIEGGYNYGWRSSYPCDDANPSPTFNTIRPLWYLGTGGGGGCCEAPTGLEVYTGNQIPQWTGHIFMATYNNSAMRHMYPSGDRLTLTTVNVIQTVSVGVDIETGPDGALWYIQGGGYVPGTLRRIIGSGGTPTPVPPTTTATATCVPAGGTAPVSIGNFFFNPQNLTIPAGTTVVWTNSAGTHTTTSDTAVWDSGNLGTGQMFSLAFNTPGAYPYHCAIHPSMIGSIIVQAGTPCATATPTVGATATPACTTNPNYQVTASAGATIVPANTYVSGSTCNSCVVNIPLPFTYSLYDTPYTSVNASNNGTLQFDNSNNPGGNTCLPTAALGNTIFAYWDNINTNINDTMGIYTSVSGVVPNRIFNIRWFGGYEANDATANIEVRLYEGQPKFEVIYGVTRGGFSATVGVQKGGDATRFTQYACNANGSIPSGMRLVFDTRVCTGERLGKP